MEVMAGFKNTELGIIPNEWSLIPLEKIADPSKKWSFTGGPFGSNLKSSDYTQDGVRVIQLQNIGDGVFHNESEIYTTHEKANELLSCNIYPNEIILSKMGDPVARASIIPNFHDRYLMCSDGIRLSVNPKEHNNYFIFLSLNFNYFRKQAESASTGSTRKRIGLSELRQLNVICPKVDEQNAIAEALSNVDALIESLEKLVEKKRQIKQGAMQELLTGKKRLPGFSGEWYGLSFLNTFQILKVKFVSFIRRLSAIVSMPTFRIVKHLDIIKDICSGFLPVFVVSTSDFFFFKIAKKAFSDRIIPAVTTTTHAGFYVELFQ